MEEKEYYVNQMKGLHVSDKVKEQVLEYAGQKMAGSGRKHLYKWGLVTAGIAAVLVFFVIPSPLSTQAKTYCQLAVYHINQMIYGAHQDVSEYATDVVQADSDGDLSLQLNEVMLDGNHLIFNYTVSSKTPRFFTVEKKNGEKYEGYFDIGIERITINGKDKIYQEDEIVFDGFYEDSSDSRTYPVMEEHCLHDFTDVLKNPGERLEIQLEVVAKNDETDDIRHFSYAFTMKNRELQLETKEIPMNRIVEQDGITFTFEKMCINTHSQRVYFHVDGLKDFSFRRSPNQEESYSFELKGVDNQGNEVFAEIKEIIDGYGYFELLPCSDAVGLNPAAAYYDFQLDYIWTDPDYVICDDAHEGEFHGKMGNAGKTFRVICK